MARKLNFSFSFDASNEDAAKRLGVVNTSYETDKRFYKLKRNTDGKGAAIIRFLPDTDGNFLLPMYRYDITNTRGEERRWISEWSPQVIGQPDPIQKTWSTLYNSRDPQDRLKAKLLTRRSRYLANIYVVKDFQNPENDGKFFVLDMSEQLREMIVNLVTGDPSIGEEPVRLFDILNGRNFNLIIKTESNRIPTYSYSKPATSDSIIWETEEEVEDQIIKNTYNLQEEFYNPDFYKTYEELQERLNYVTFDGTVFNVPDIKDSETQEKASVEPKTVEPKTVEPKTVEPKTVEPILNPLDEEVEPITETKKTVTKKAKKTSKASVADVDDLESILNSITLD